MLIFFLLFTLALLATKAALGQDLRAVRDYFIVPLFPSALNQDAGRRDVKILPNLMEWLVRHQHEDSRITPPQTRHLAWRREAVAATGAHWPENGARHSFGTYYAKLNGYRAAADALGHVGGIRMLMDHYSGPCSRAQAEAFFQIVPAKAGQVIEMRQAKS